MCSTPRSETLGDRVAGVVDPGVEGVYARHLDHVVDAADTFLGPWHGYDALSVVTEVDGDGSARTTVAFRGGEGWQDPEEVRACRGRGREDITRFLQEVNGTTSLLLASRLRSAGMLPNRVSSLVLFRLGYRESQWDYGPLLDPADSEYQKRNWSLEDRCRVADTLWSDYLEAWSGWWRRFLDGATCCEAVTYVHMGRGTHNATTRFICDDYWVMNHSEAYAHRSSGVEGSGEMAGFQDLMEASWDVADQHDLGVVRRALENVGRVPCDVVVRYDPATGSLSEEWLAPDGGLSGARIVGSRFERWLSDHGYVRYQEGLA
ncbi:hypothetical protein D4740_05385 [Actinomyces sp. 2119]|uniref:Uncharacterized protein n=1 Tax=Actinomyces lilanjuaniae TaxID=2321394 RepID=A0ABM6Z342_9ACTO|nr:MULTISPECIES: hypothetical protein [Actinomyces]AYD89375.1 hypothetical protein D5R93_03585 [Actinomyces lilanjuaniae]RJF43275.1 hypothetical protein D4740_05385 [Actinomyces sp. 2119]